MNGRNFLRIALIVMITGILLAMVAYATPPEPVASIEGVTEYRLENGLRILLMPDKSTANFTVNMTVRAGVRQQKPDERGVAHIVEHMMLQGTAAHPDLPKLLNERGADYNAMTWNDGACYYETMLSNKENLQLAIKLEADRLVNLAMRASDVKNEITVVLNEMEKSHDSPAEYLIEEVKRTAFRKHMYGTPTLGDREEIEAFTVDKLHRLYKRLYRPDNAILIVTGNFDADDALELARNHFGAIAKPATPIDIPNMIEPPQQGQRIVRVSDEGGQPMVIHGYRVPAVGHIDSAAANVFCVMLSTKLNEALKASKKSTGGIASASPSHDPGIAIVGADVLGVDNMSDVQEVINKLVANPEKWMDEDALARAKTSLQVAFDTQMNDANAFATVLCSWSTLGDWRLRFVFEQRVAATTLDQVQVAAAKYFRPSNCTTGIYVPAAKSDAIEIPAAPPLDTIVSQYVAKKPVAVSEAPEFEVTFDAIEERATNDRLENGLTLRMLPKKSRGNVVSMCIKINYGDMQNLAGRKAAAELLPTLLLRGTAGMSQVELGAELDKVRAGARSNGSIGSLNLTFVARREQLAAALVLLRKILREPDFPANEFEILRRGQLQQLAAQQVDPTMLAIEHLQAKLEAYDADDFRHARNFADRKQQMERVTVDDVRELYSQFLGAESTTVTIVGDFDPVATRPLLADVFADWTAEKKYARVPDIASKPAPSRHAIRTPGMENATYLAAMPLEMSARDADYPALVIANKILGGSSLQSRLADRVRQQSGLSYHVASEIEAETLDRSGMFTMIAISAPKNADKVAALIDEELKKLIADGITSDEFVAARDATIAEIKSALGAGDEVIARVLCNIASDGRSLKELTEMLAKVEALTVDRVNAAIRKYLDAEKLTIVQAGDFPAPVATTEETAAR